MGRAKALLPSEIAQNENLVPSIDSFALQNDVFESIFTPPGLRAPIRKQIAEKCGLAVEDVQDLELFFTIPYFGEPKFYSQSGAESRGNKDRSEYFGQF